jgi:hypothetical protein
MPISSLGLLPGPAMIWVMFGTKDYNPEQEQGNETEAGGLESAGRGRGGNRKAPRPSGTPAADVTSSILVRLDQEETHR